MTDALLVFLAGCALATVEILVGWCMGVSHTRDRSAPAPAAVADQAPVAAPAVGAPPSDQDAPPRRRDQRAGPR